MSVFNFKTLFIIISFGILVNLSLSFFSHRVPKKSEKNINYENFTFELSYNYQNCTKKVCYGIPVLFDENGNEKTVCVRLTPRKYIYKVGGFVCKLLGFDSLFGLSFSFYLFLEALNKIKLTFFLKRFR